MAPTRQLSTVKRAQILALSQEGYSSRYIAAKFRISSGTVTKTIQRFQAIGTFADRGRSGRPKATSPRMDNSIHRYCQIDPSISSTEIQSELNNSGLEAPSTRTIRRRLKDTFKLPARKPARKPLLNPEQRQKRIEFCRTHENWTGEQWRSLMFSDEATISQFKTFRPFVRRPAGKRLDPRFLAPTLKKSKTTMVWGCISGSGVGPIQILPSNQTINGERYRALLDTILLPAMGRTNCTIFQQDGAPAHKSHVVREWFQIHNVQVLDWPGNSPDLNPIENLWSIFKKKIAAYHPENVNDLNALILQIWNHEIDRELCEKLCNSMPDRIQAVLQARGYPTRY